MSKPAAISDHLTKLFHRCAEEAPGSLIEIDRGLPGDKSWGFAYFQANDDGIDKAVGWATTWNKAGWNVWIGVNPRKPDTDQSKPATDAAIDLAFFNFGDCDSKESYEIFREDAAPIRPTMTIGTGTTPWSRGHPYWELDTPARNLVAWRETQAGIAAYFRGDPVIDPRRIMRLAGTISYPTPKKEERGYVAELVTYKDAWDGESRTAADTAAMHSAYAAYKPQNEPHSPSSPGLNLPGATHNSLTLIDAVRAGNNWHNNIIALVAHWIGRGWTDQEILLSSLAFTEAGYTHQQTTDEVNKAIKGGRDKWGKPDPVHLIEDGPPEPTVINVTPWSDIQVSTETTDFVEETLGLNQMSVIYGESNTGKTFFALDLAIHVAFGWKWRGKEVDKCAAIYCALEGKHGVQNRIAAIKKEYKDRMNGEEPAFGVVTTSVNLLDPDADTGPLIEAIRAEKTRLGVTTAMLVIDTLSRAMAGGNENAPDDMGALVANSDRIRLEAFTHTMWVHHSGKDQARGARGHSLLRAATDTEIEVSSSDGVSIAEVKKQREFEGGEQYAFSLRKVTVGVNERGKEITSCIVQQAEMPAKAKRPEPTGDNQKIVLAALREELSRDDAPRLPEGFPNVKYVPLRQLRGAVEASMEGETKRVTQAFQTAFNSLISRGYIARKGDMIWPTN